MCLPALVNAVSVARGGVMVVHYDTYSYQLRVVLS